MPLKSCISNLMLPGQQICAIDNGVIPNCWYMCSCKFYKFELLLVIVYKMSDTCNEISFFFSKKKLAQIIRKMYKICKVECLANEIAKVIIDWSATRILCVQGVYLKSTLKVGNILPWDSTFVTQHPGHKKCWGKCQDWKEFELRLVQVY